MLDWDLTTILLFGGGLIIIRIVEWRISKNAPPLKRAYNFFVAGLLATGLLVFALILSMPSGHFYVGQNFKSLDDVHEYLREQSRDLARLRDIVFLFLLLFVGNLLQALHGFAKAVAALERNNEQGNRKPVTVSAPRQS
jgi:hypothetical protein